MKIAIITDTHCGVRQDNVNMLDHQKLFYDTIFFPFIKKQQIDAIFHLGDIVDRRKYINFNTLSRLNKDFLEPLAETKKPVYMIAGNHDVYYKNTNELNAFEELIKNKFNFNFYTKPHIETFGKQSILFLPWITHDNEIESIDAIDNTKAKIVCAHLQLQGFEMHKGAFAETGMDKSVFDKFSSVLSGHFHHKSDFNNIHYLGCPFEMNWGDYGDSKGFHTFDTETLDLTFIPNPHKLFHKVVYDDENTTLEDILAKDFSEYQKSYVKVVTRNKNNSFWFDTFIEKIEQVEPTSLQVIEDASNLAFDGEENDLIQIEDTITLLSKYCEQIGVNENLKPKLNELLQSLYNEASVSRI